MHKQEDNNKKSNTLIRVHEYTDYSQWLVDKHFEEGAEKGKDTTLIKTQVDFWNETYKGDKERKKTE